MQPLPTASPDREEVSWKMRWHAPNTARWPKFVQSNFYAVSQFPFAWWNAEKLSEDCTIARLKASRKETKGSQMTLLDPERAEYSMLKACAMPLPHRSISNPPRLPHCRPIFPFVRCSFSCWASRYYRVVKKLPQPFMKIAPPRIVWVWGAAVAGAPKLLPLWMNESCFRSVFCALPW